jgi:hypothetical protein
MLDRQEVSEVQKHLVWVPAIDGEAWHFAARRWWYSRFASVNPLLQEFRPFNPTTNQVRDY